MDLKDLRSRLDSIKQQAADDNPVVNPSKKDTPETEKLLLDNGWSKISDMVYEKVSVSKNILPGVISDVLTEAASPSEKETPASRLYFYDTETTGLSAGAGNMVFLAGFGETEQNTQPAKSFRTTQIFLSDFPGEPAFLERLQDFINPNRIYVSYNGKSFDSNVLRTRFIMNGMKTSFGYQLDLLYSSRRLWKNIIGSCSLGDIERRVLDKRRVLDVPGFMVPDLYFDFIRGARWESIEGVLAHHLEDIKSLAELLFVHEQLFEDSADFNPKEKTGSTEYFDPLGLAALLSAGYPDKASAVLKSSWIRGNHNAGKELSLYHKRTGNWNEAVRIWGQLWSERKSIFAGIELAKYYEHREKNLRSAIEITESMLELERFKLLPYREELEKRRQRLKDKTIKE